MDEPVPGRRGQQPPARVGPAELETQHLGVVRLDLAQLVHELQLVHPVSTATAQSARAAQGTAVMPESRYCSLSAFHLSALIVPWSISRRTPDN